MAINYCLVLAGKFVFVSGILLVAGILVVPPTVPLAPLVPELVTEVSAELPGVLWLQPTRANAARPVIADSAIVDFIKLVISWLFLLPSDLIPWLPPRQPDVRKR
jgi:hypothetical protein